jgi:hypothetical protein
MDQHPSTTARQNAAKWRTIEARLRTDAEQWHAIAEQATPRAADLPKHLAEEYAAGVSQRYRDLARFAENLADEAATSASDYESQLSTAVPA